MSLLSALLAVGLGGVMSLGSQPVPTPLDDELPFGTTFQGTRSTVVLSEPEEFFPSDTALVEGDRPVVTTVTVTNEGIDTMKKHEFGASATCGGVKAPMIYDTDLDGMTPPGDILPGRRMQWDLGFALPAETCELIVTMTFQGDELYFVGEV